MRQNQKIRVIVNDIHFYSTVKAVQNGVGDHTALNIAVTSALYCLANTRKKYGDRKAKPVTGITGSWNGFQIQLDLVK